MKEFDCIVIGGGPAGYPAAIRASQLGARVCLVEKARLGGTCLNWGCIPTKALQAAAHLLEQSREAQRRSVVSGSISIDASGLFERKNKIVEELVSGIEKLLQARRIELFRGTARIVNEREVEVEGVGKIAAPKMIIATGSTEIEIASIPFDGERVISSKDLLEIGRIPGSICIVGGGVIGCEFASIFVAFGSRVTIVEMLPALVSAEDAQISRALTALLRKKGVDVRLGTRVISQRKTQSGIAATLSTGEEIECEVILVSVGRRANFSELGIEKLGIDASSSGIKVNSRMETSREGIYAAGDVVGGMLLAHVATREGVVAAENALGGRREVRYDTVPVTIYSLPEISRVGLTEAEARKRGETIVAGRFPFAANGKAKGLAEEDGFVKWIARASDHKLLGIHIIGPYATELLSPAIVALDRGLTAEQYAESIFPHPTLSETLAGAADAICGRAIDLIR